ncbi:delta-lactam-biosynthetic de-N-acetylase [Rossellomorea vietnamensis]|uniref:Delta-lactam-biosynthetic de-N-acetylase n=2 Tax=Rossellomorea TaxID=2837508 RepID=A0A5D4KFW3_9BACI|nr:MULTISPECIES: delta-lactam-biosynthetic de-N-acetylase [Rossellomorea]TYR75826.1 delta-lactam-biosynthetic de-N-acetylase [Rossellomorea vietnamensis]TYS81034.1 delta-lactam-biosynthetic de-N-acetylase [Rossellomorea aquimaris]
MKKVLTVIVAAFLTFGIIDGNTQASQVPNKSIGWGFKKGNEGKQAEAGKTYDELLKKYGAFYKDSPDEKVLYLTFDNGYENGYTGKILDVLKEEKVPAAFFVTGHYLNSAPDLVKRMANEGHIVGNHSWSHPDLTAVSDEKLRKELDMVKEKTAEITKQQTMAYLRPPRGVFSERTMKLAKDAGYTHVLWSLAFVDWHTDSQKGWQYSYNNIMKQIHPGAVMLLHTVSKDNAEALGKVIKDLKKEGYTFKSLDYYEMSKNGRNPLLTP